MPRAKEEMIRVAAQHIQRSERLVVFSGAGMSADAGIGTFRGQGGAWSGLLGGLRLLYGGTPFGWWLTPSLTWRLFVRDFLAPIMQAEPHAGHRALARLQRLRFPGELMSIITMNVDGLHQASGSKRVREVHGTVRAFRCGQCSAPVAVDNPLEHAAQPPHCDACGGLARPDCTLFGEGLPEAQWQLATDDVAALGEGDVLLVVGTSSVVQPAASIPAFARARGARIIEINPEDSPLTELTEMQIRAGAAEALLAITELVLADAQAGSGGPLK